MPTSVISGTIVDGSGAVVTARIVPKGATRISDGAVVDPEVVATADGSGNWNFTLEEQSNISPSNSYYAVEEYKNGESNLYAISVPANDSNVNAVKIGFVSPGSPFAGAHTHAESEVINLVTDLAAAVTDAEHLLINHAGITGVGITGQGAGSNSVLVGDSAVASADQSVALGDFAVSSVDGGIVIGSGTNATSAPLATGQGAIAIGSSDDSAILGARAEGIGAVAIGSGTASARGARALANGAIAIGGGTTSPGARAEGVQGIGIGEFSWGLGNQSVAIGVAAEANDTGAVAIGNSTNCDGLRATAVGNDAQAYGDESVALGDGAIVSVSHDRGVAIGNGAATTAADQIMLGVAAHTIVVPGKFAGASRMGWHLRRAAVQSINADSSTDISWDTEDQDTPGNFTPPGTTLTIPSGGDGLWAVTFVLVAGATMSSMGFLMTTITAGGIIFTNTDFDDVSNPIVGSWTLSVPNIPLVATNTIVAAVRHTAFAATNFTGRLLAYRVGA